MADEGMEKRMLDRIIQSAHFKDAVSDMLQSDRFRDAVEAICKKTTEADIVIFAIPYVKQVCADVLLFLIGVQPETDCDANYFGGTKYQKLMNIVSDDLNKPYCDVKDLFNRSVVLHDEIVHACERADLDSRVQSAVDLFTRHPQLAEQCQDEQHVIFNYTSLMQSREMWILQSAELNPTENATTTTAPSTLNAETNYKVQTSRLS